MDRESIRSAVERLYAEGARYVDSKDIAEKLEIDATTGELSLIGARVSELECVEEWGKSRSTTWHIHREP